MFVLFLNDIVQGLHPATNVTMYADDTKIWRNIIENDDHLILQRDIDYLFDWAIRNKMRFHPSKCKVLMVSKINPSSNLCSAVCTILLDHGEKDP